MPGSVALTIAKCRPGRRVKGGSCSATTRVRWQDSLTSESWQDYQCPAYLRCDRKCPDVRVNYVPIRMAIGRSLLSGDMPDPEKYPADGRAIDTQQVFSGGGTDSRRCFARSSCSGTDAH